MWRRRTPGPICLNAAREVMEAWAEYCVEPSPDALTADGATSGTVLAALGGSVWLRGLPAGIISDVSNPPGPCRTTR